MSALRKLLIFLLIFVILGMATFGFFPNFWLDTVSGIFGWPGGTEYTAASVAADGTVYALGAGRRGQTVTSVNAFGEKLARFRLFEKMFPERYTVEGFFGVSDEAFLIALYGYDGAGNATNLQLLLISGEGKTAALVMDLPCEGATLAGQRASQRISSFTAYDGDVYFAVGSGTDYILYAFTPGENVVRPEGSFTCRYGVLSFAALPDGAAALAMEDGGVRIASAKGTVGAPILKGRVVEAFFPGPDGFAYIDAVTGGLYTYNMETAVETLALDLSALPDDEPGLIPAKLNAVGFNGEDAALLSGGTNLAVYYSDDGEYADCGAYLYPSPFACAATLAGTVLGLLILSYAVWYGVAFSRRMRVPLILRKGVVLLFLLAVLINGWLLLFVRPRYAADAENEAYAALETAVAVSGGDPAKLSGTLLSLAGTDTRMRDTAYAVFDSAAYEDKKTEEIRYDLTVAVDEAGLGDGTGLALPWRNAYYYENAAAAIRDGAVNAVSEMGGRGYYSRFVPLGDGSVLAVSVAADAFRDAAGSAFLAQALAAEALGLALWLVALLMFSGVAAGLRRVIKGVDLINAGSLSVEIVQPTGDELEELAEAFNNVAATLDATVTEGKRRSDSYMRFVPQEIIDLLGEHSVEDVGKQSFVSRRMAAMMVGFSFPEEVYESRTRALFDNINEVVEKTAGIVTQNGGTIYNFTYSSYDAVFPGEVRQAVSTAVMICQEIIALNKERELKGAPLVTLHIAMDVDNVMMGIVGDERRMVPVAISTGFSTVRNLVALCSKLEASILVTEAVAPSAAGYKNRYVGKSGEIRVYEIYEGDAYGAKTDKEAASRQFSEGVYLFYTGDFSRAKSIFMDIAQQRRRDGAARYYLYLADSYEKERPGEVGL